MLKKLLLIAFTLFAIESQAQVTIKLNNSTAGNIELKDSYTATYKGGKLTVGSKSFEGPLAWNLSQEKDLFAVLVDDADKFYIQIIEASGTQLSSFEVSGIDYDDSSLSLFISDEGYIVLQKNGASFEYYAFDGTLINVGSNISGSKEGETNSTLYMVPNSFRQIAANPQIKINGSLNNSASNLFTTFNPNKTSLSYNSGSFPVAYGSSIDGSIVAVAVNEVGAKQSELKIFTKYGKLIKSITTTLKEPVGITIDESNSYATIHSTGRMQVYSIQSGKRLGSSSVGKMGQIQTALFSAKDQVLIAVMGLNTNTSIDNLGIYAVNLKRKKIAKDLTSLSILNFPGNALELKRNKTDNYTIHGYSQSISIKTSF